MIAAAQDLGTATIGREGTSLKERLQVVDAGQRFFSGANEKATQIAAFPGITYIGHEESTATGLLDFKSVGSFYTASGEKIQGLNLCSFSIPDPFGKSLSIHNSDVGVFNQRYSNALNVRECKDSLGLNDEQMERLLFHLTSLPGWINNVNNEVQISRADILALAASRQNPTPELYFDERRKVLFVISNHAVAALVPSAGGDKYTFNYVGDDRTLDGKTLAKYPGLPDILAERDPAAANTVATREGELLKVTSRPDGKLLYSDRVTAHLLTDDTLYFARVGSSTIYSAPIDELKSISTKFEKTPARLDGEIKGLNVDPNGNFIIAAVARGGAISLDIIERESGEVCSRIENASEKFSIGKNGEIAYIDSSGAPRLAQTNFTEFKEGEPSELRIARLRELGAVNSQLDNLDALLVPRLKPENGDYTTEAGLEKNARNRLGAFFTPKIEKAGKIEELTRIEDDLEQLKAQPQFARHLNIFEGVEAALQRRKDVVRISGFDEALNTLAAGLSEYDTPLEGVRLRREFAKLEEERRQLLVMDSGVRAELDGRLSELRENVRVQLGTIGQALLQEIGEQFTSVQKLLKEVGSAPEVLLVASSQNAADFRELLELFQSPYERDLWEQKFDSAVQGRRNEILLAQETHKSALRAQSNQQVEECRELLREIEDVYQEAKARGQLELLTETNPLVKRLRERSAELPEKDGKLFSERLSDIMQARREALAQPAPAQPQGTTKETRTTTFIRESFPIFAAPDLVWKPEVIATSPDADHGTLVFWSNFGQEYRPKIGNVPIDLNDQATVKAIQDHEAKAAKFFSSQKRQVPQIKSSWAVTEYHKQYLDEMAFLCREQLENQRHLLMLEGESGTGKNILWSVFANATNRELFRFPCNAQMEKEDLTATKQYSAEKGTHKLLSELVRKIQTPGTIILFDEFNALPTGTAKILNSLFDEDRSIIVDGKTYKCDPTVILAGAMNPKGYAGTKSLSTEVKGRTRFLSVDYPPEKTKDGKFTSYEAEMLAKQLPNFKALTGPEFRSLWDYVINNDKLSGGDAFLTPEREKEIKNLREIVAIAAKLRAAYAKYQLRETSEIVNVPFSLRESVDAATCMSNPRFATVKDAIKSVFVPKGEDALEKANIEKVILS